MHVKPYEFSRAELDPVRRRKLLLHHQEIAERGDEDPEKGLTLVPLRVYFKDGRAKVEIGLAKGKRNYDKRQVLAERDAKRETERALRGRGGLRSSARRVPGVGGVLRQVRWRDDTDEPALVEHEHVRELGGRRPV